jgi:hydroxymethylpyrimidine pyrophosphatase-like HAD family hydrolase
MKIKTLVFLDIDGTLLGPDYRPNSSKAQKLIKKLSRKGYLFCLNSNRAWNDLAPVARMFHINGPVIAENGVFFVLGGKKRFLIKPKLIQSALHEELLKLSKNKKSRVENIPQASTFELSEKKIVKPPKSLLNCFPQDFLVIILLPPPLSLQTYCFIPETRGRGWQYNVCKKNFFLRPQSS